MFLENKLSEAVMKEQFLAMLAWLSCSISKQCVKQVHCLQSENKVIRLIIMPQFIIQYHAMDKLFLQASKSNLIVNYTRYCQYLMERGWAIHSLSASNLIQVANLSIRVLGGFCFCLHCFLEKEVTYLSGRLC